VCQQLYDGMKRKRKSDQERCDLHRRDGEDRAARGEEPSAMSPRRRHLEVRHRTKARRLNGAVWARLPIREP
jgi:hypothetical protein